MFVWMDVIVPTYLWRRILKSVCVLFKWSATISERGFVGFNNYLTLLKKQRFEGDNSHFTTLTLPRALNFAIKYQVLPVSVHVHGKLLKVGVLDICNVMLCCVVEGLGEWRGVIVCESMLITIECVHRCVK